MTTLTTRVLRGATTTAVAAFAVGAARSYQRDLEEARDRLSAVKRDWVDTPFGTVEYAESGAGDPVLVSHGIFHGCDAGLLSVKDLLPGRRIIAPSRFGYLGSELPPTATPEAQADAFAALLDHLQLPAVDVVGISAGTTAALLFALRHPARIHHLVMLSANFPGDPTAAAPPASAKLLYADLPMWLLKKVAHTRLTRLMGVPAGFPQTLEQEVEVERMIDSIFPVGPRVAGAVFDAYVSNPAVNDLPIEEIAAATVIIHAKDDPLCSFAPAQAAAKRIPNCTLVALESGGHLGLGQARATREALDQFLTVAAAA